MYHYEMYVFNKTFYIQIVKWVIYVLRFHLNVKNFKMDSYYRSSSRFYPAGYNLMTCTNFVLNFVALK